MTSSTFRGLLFTQAGPLPGGLGHDSGAPWVLPFPADSVLLRRLFCPNLAELFPVTAIFIHNACVTERLLSTMMRHLCNQSHTPPKQEKRRRIKATPLIGGWGVENPKPVKGISLGGLGWAYERKDGASPLRHMTRGEAAVVLLKTLNPKSSSSAVNRNYMSHCWHKAGLSNKT